jgi:hypothetical protein
MKKLVKMVVALAVLAVFSFGCGGYAAKDGKETKEGKTWCEKCGVDSQLTEEMKRYQKENAH